MDLLRSTRGDDKGGGGAAPGDVVVHTIAADRELFIQRGSFMASWPNVETDAKFKGWKGMLAGEGLFFLRAYTTDGLRVRNCFSLFPSPPPCLSSLPLSLPACRRLQTESSWLCSQEHEKPYFTSTYCCSRSGRCCLRVRVLLHAGCEVGAPRQREHREQASMPPLLGGSGFRRLFCARHQNTWRAGARGWEGCARGQHAWSAPQSFGLSQVVRALVQGWRARCFSHPMERWSGTT